MTDLNEAWCERCRVIYSGEYRVACPRCGHPTRSAEDITGVNIAAPPGSDAAVHGPPTLPHIPGYCPKCGNRVTPLPPVDVTPANTAYCAACDIRYDDTTGEIHS